MRAILESIGISRQGHSQQAQRGCRELEDHTLILNEVRKLRVLHPRMGGRKLYDILRPPSMGRDRFMRLLADADLSVATRRSTRRTTFSVKAWRYSNLMEGLVINGIDQVWVTDITYFFIGEECFYIALIMDVYSRKVLGYSVEPHMRTESCLAALQLALRGRGRRKFGQALIHHSDRGGQYASNAYTDTLEKAEIRISMCLVVYENTHLERLNGTIKNEYLAPYNPRNLKELKKKLVQTVQLYNGQRPHDSLKGLTPVGFEQYLTTIRPEDRESMSIYVDPATVIRDKLRNQLTIFD